MRYARTRKPALGHVKHEGDHEYVFEFWWGNYGGQDGCAGVETYYAPTYSIARMYFFNENKHVYIDAVYEDGNELDGETIDWGE